ncbi:hypothetical protein NEOLEDRAFT_1182133 [Neolentinus lepideus HHB14362 ss-1]|uniref:Uncharacterized protein n=1 Tax=Neolentinus lepideus HHB14362 ss-1 TaxID=1314782 RepID=A0A165PED9_9AGAM|nr:hypothetical protein NEOLEDRAFT_1182133 [Neolentinus lepideus HHB14362 ss-1]
MPMTLLELFHLVERYTRAFGDDAANILVTLTANGEGLHLRWADNPPVAPRPNPLGPAASLLGLVPAPSEASSVDPDYAPPAEDQQDYEYRDQDIDMDDIHPDGLINDILVGFSLAGCRVDRDGRIVRMNQEDRGECAQSGPQQGTSRSRAANTNDPDEHRSPTPGPSRPREGPLSRQDTEPIIRAPPPPAAPSTPPVSRPSYYTSPELDREVEEERARRIRRRHLRMSLRRSQPRKSHK